MNNHTKGYILASIGAATYGMNPLFALPLYGMGMNPDSVLFFRYLFTIPLLGGMLWFRGHDFRVTKRQLLALFVFGLLFSYSSLALFQSYNYMDAGIASTLLFIYPLLVAIIMMLCFKERVTGSTILCIGMAMCGIGLLYKGADGSTLSLTGTLLVFASSLSYAIYLVGANRVGLKEIPTLKVTFYVLLFGSSLFATRLLMTGEVQTPAQWYGWGNLLGLAVFPTAVSLLCTTAAIQRIGSTPTAILGALEPVTAVVIGITLFGERLTSRDMGGLVLILVAVSLVVAGGSISAPLMRLRKMFPRLRRWKKP